MRKIINVPEFSIPSSIFVNSGLSAFDDIVVYLIERENLTFSDVDQVLKVKEGKAWMTYNRAKIKE